MGEMADQAGHDGKVRLVAAKNIKFTSPVLPSETAELRFNLSGEGTDRTVEILAGDMLCAKMSLTVE
jgi:3-hydroxymyristoyl/3-hydroxydecanoyl-(acyl carrier protein) dehydratase